MFLLFFGIWILNGISLKIQSVIYIFSVYIYLTVFTNNQPAASQTKQHLQTISPSIKPITMNDFSNPSFGILDESSSAEDESNGAIGALASLAVRRRNFRPSTRISLLVESLVKSLVSAYEPDNTERSRRTYKKICGQLFQMGLIDESWNMNELEGVRVQFQHALFGLLDPPFTSATSFLMQNTYSSQYQREFDELENIGGGAFGKVFRVRHKLDGREYAVKKIPIQSERLNSVKNYLSEVKTFASLNHPNIVEYRAAWLELGTSKIVNNNGTNRLTNGRYGNFSFDSEVAFPSLSTTNEDNSELITDLIQSTSAIPTKTEPFLLHRDATSNNIKTVSDSNLEIVFEYSNPGENSSSTKSKTNGKALVPTVETIPKKTRKSWATLFIQMALCHGTLDQWLRHRNDTCDAEVALIPSNGQVLRTKAIQEILIQILRGLDYIHSRGVVHHDIKPSNIFVSANPGSLLVQLGDFGLACPLQCTRHGFARGTPLYAAPEQLAGRCDSKSDMYSLGIVLFELLEDFGTAMERSRRISELRNRTDPPVPTDMNLNNLVSALVRFNPSERPDALGLLKALEGAKEASRPNLEAMRESLEEKEKEIERLRELLKTHGINQ